LNEQGEDTRKEKEEEEGEFKTKEAKYKRCRMVVSVLSA